MAHRRNWFSNMLPMDEPLVYQGMRFATVEHFYQAMKLRRDDVEPSGRIQPRGQPSQRALTLTGAERG